MRIAIYLEVEDDSKYADPEHEMGITSEAFDRLTEYPAPLGWLGEVQDVKKEAE